MMNSVNSEASDTAYNYCINKAVPDGSNLYYATIFDTAQNKTLIITFHAFLYELSDIIYECSDPGVARIKLKWWQEEIERLSNNQARHPVMRQMQESLNLDQNLKSTFDNVINSFNDFLFVKQTDSLDSILSLYKSTAGELWYQCGHHLHPENNESLELMRELGALIHFISCLQQPNTYMNETRCIIPASYVSINELLNLRLQTTDKQAKQKDFFSPLLTDLKTKLNEIHKKLNIKDKSQFQHALILNRLATKTCDEILRDDCSLLEKNISLTPLRKLWVAWYTHYLA